LAKPNKKVLEEAIKGADLVHIVLPFALGKTAMKIAKKLDVPFTTAFHCQPENISSHIGMKDFKLVNDFIYKIMRDSFYNKADYIHCPSEFIEDELNKNKYTAKKFVISNGVIPTFHKKQVEKPNELKDKICILFSGRYSKEKRHDLLIKAVSKSKYEKNIQLIFAGTGPLQNKLLKLSQKYKLTNTPIFKFMSKEDLCDTINYCDLYCHPSDVEIEAISCLEAITCGLVPIISNSNRSATRFFALTEKNLFKRGDYKDLANKIDYFIEHKEEKEELSKKYIEYAKQFDINNSIDKMIDMFNTAINDHKNKTNKK
jgi:1,2-diacylglycerol 3-alpha-glucosyltransferase